MLGIRQASRRHYLPSLRHTQRKIASSSARFKIVACGRRWGKTTLGMHIAIGHVLDGKSVWWVAPTYKQAYHPWRIFKRRFASSWAAKIEQDRHIELDTGGSITVKSAEEPDNLRGFGLDLVVVDEAAFLPEEVWTGILRPALADRGGSALILSTPRGRNWFHAAFQRGLDPLNPDWQSWAFPTTANPNIKPEEVEEARRTLPERIFQQEFEARFLEDGGAVFRHIRRAAIAPYGVQPTPGHTYLMGIDFARYEDFTALVVMDAEDCSVVALDRFGGIDWGLQRAKIISLANRWGVSAILAEANAIGEPNIEMLLREGLPVRGFVTSALTKPPLIEGLVAAIENGDVRLLPDPVLLGELESYTYRTSRSGHTVYEAPPGRHDDTVIALALAFRLATTPRLVFGIAES